MVSTMARIGFRVRCDLADAGNKVQSLPPLRPGLWSKLRRGGNDDKSFIVSAALLLRGTNRLDTVVGDVDKSDNDRSLGRKTLRFVVPTAPSSSWPLLEISCDAIMVLSRRRALYDPLTPCLRLLTAIVFPSFPRESLDVTLSRDCKWFVLVRMFCSKK
jgi:hypothetical protein